MELGGGAAAAADEDRLSALPDDVLVLILLKLGTRAAARTRVLSHHWRHIWALLPVLRFPSPPEPHRLRDALDDHKVLLRDLHVGTNGTTAESLAVWLPAAARRVSGDLALVTDGPGKDLEDYDSEEEEEATQRGAFEFPCFEQASRISFCLGYQGLALPVTGVFARLIVIQLARVWFLGPGELGDAMSSPRCPCLLGLFVDDARGLRHLTIHSESLLFITLKKLRTLSQLTIVAPALKNLTVEACFLKSRPVANVSAPLLTKLEWADEYDPSSVHLGEMAHVQCLLVYHYLVYGQFFMDNDSCLSLFQCFQGIKSLFLPLWYPQDLENCDYMMEEMGVLPDITFLTLAVMANGHAFQASVFHVLRLCTGLRSLMLLLIALESEDQTVCTSDCKCLELIDWETEELLLNHLEEGEINKCRGTEHEVAFVKRLFDWGTNLKEMTVTLCDSVSEVKAKVLFQTFQSFLRPGVRMKFCQHENSPKD